MLSTKTKIVVDILISKYLKLWHITSRDLNKYSKGHFLIQRETKNSILILASPQLFPSHPNQDLDIYFFGGECGNITTQGITILFYIDLKYFKGNVL